MNPEVAKTLDAASIYQVSILIAICFFFMMYAISTLFLGYLFRQFLPGTEILKSGQEVDIWRIYISGCILLGIAPGGMRATRS